MPQCEPGVCTERAFRQKTKACVGKRYSKGMLLYQNCCAGDVIGDEVTRLAAQRNTTLPALVALQIQS